ncbi:MAG: multidrug ABC transporter ATP-binding protein, partial [Rhodobacteraceae bacterium]|nr:multidrug ABC transporter ATP-binding protein [Paracoccaceae bacterium]
LFLDEPTAGVDVELRNSMWETVAGLRAQGVTIILTTHYIQEAELMADRIAVIADGKILLVEDKATLMSQMGQKQLKISLSAPIAQVPEALAGRGLELADDGHALLYAYDIKAERTGITALLNDLQTAGLQMTDLETQQSSLEDIFVGLLKGQGDAP